jgi:regulatory protein
VISNRQSFDKAKEYSFLLLKFRLRSEKEVYLRLKQKRFTEEVIRQVISFLKEKGFIDDAAFARAWAESRLKKPLGIRRIRQELVLKGIDKGIIEAALGEIKENYSERELVETLARERLNRLKGIEPRLARQRIFAYLVRRGFSPDVITEVLS